MRPRGWEEVLAGGGGEEGGWVLGLSPAANTVGDEARDLLADGVDLRDDTHVELGVQPRGGPAGGTLLEEALENLLDHLQRRLITREARARDSGDLPQQLEGLVVGGERVDAGDALDGELQPVDVELGAAKGKVRTAG